MIIREKKRFAININKMTAEATQALYDLDNSFVGTENYMGLTYFWAYEYRHYLREASMPIRRKIHNTFLKLGMDVGGESLKHAQIISAATKIPLSNYPEEYK